MHPQTSIGNNVRLIFYHDCDMSRADLQFRKKPAGDGFLFQSVRAESHRPADTHARSYMRMHMHMHMHMHMNMHMHSMCM